MREGAGKEGRKVSSPGREVLVTLRLVFTHSYLLPLSASFPLDASHCVTGARAPFPSLSWHQDVGCHLLTPRSCDAPTAQGCQSFSSSGIRKAEATAGEATGTRLLDMGKQVPTSSGQHKPRQLWRPCSPGQWKPMAFYWQWKKYWASNPLFIVTEPQAITQERSKDITNSTTPQGFWIKNEQHSFPVCLLFPVLSCLMTTCTGLSEAHISLSPCMATTSPGKWLIFISNAIFTISQTTMIIELTTIGCKVKLKIPAVVANHGITFKDAV